MAPELLTVIVASVSCVVFCLVVVMLAVVLYRKDPLCCRFRTQAYTEDLPQYSSRHSLIGIAHDGNSAGLNQGVIGPQLPRRLFIIGKPSDYYLEGPLPRLPSYESVRKKDRQRQIHNLIAQRFGLDGCHDEPPPTYEETLRQSFEFSHVGVQPLDIHLSMNSQDDCSNLREGAHNPHQPSTAPQRVSPP